MAYIANMPEWLSKDRLMLWILRCLKDLGGRAHLDPLYWRLGQLLRIPEDLLWENYPPEARQEDYVVRHRMRWVLTDLGFLGLVHCDGEGNWSLEDKGTAFLEPLDQEDVPMAERDWSKETGIKLTSTERKLERKLIADKQAEHKRRYPNKAKGGASAPSRPPPPRPDDWPRGPFTSGGAPNR